MIKTVADLKKALEDMPDDFPVEIYTSGDECYSIDFVEKIEEEDYVMVTIFSGNMKEI